MSYYTVEKLMEITGETRPGFAIQYIQEAYREMAIEKNVPSITKDYHIVTGRIAYDLPSDCTTNIGVFSKNVVYGSELMNSDYFAIGYWTNNGLTSFEYNGYGGSYYNGLYGIAPIGTEYVELDNDSILVAGQRYTIEYTTRTGHTGTFIFELSTGEDLHTILSSAGIHRFEFIAKRTGDKLRISASTVGTLHVTDISLKRSSRDKYKPIPRIVSDLNYSYFNEKEESLEQWTNDLSVSNIKNEDRLANMLDTDNSTAVNDFSDASNYVFSRMWGYQIRANKLFLYEYNANESQENGYPVELLENHFVPPTVNINNGLRIEYMTGDAIFYSSSGVPETDPSESSIIKDRKYNVDAIIEFVRHRIAFDNKQYDESEYLKRLFYEKLSKSKNALSGSPRIITTRKVYAIK
jgi:hypothetical protein